MGGGNIKKTDLGLIADEDEVIDRCKSLCADYGFSFQHWSTLELFLESESDVRFILASLKNFVNDTSAAELAQAVRFMNQDAFLVCAVPGTLGKETAQFAKKSGANLILLKSEITESSKLEFAMSQVLRSNYIPLKTSDLFTGIEIPVDIYHLLPQREKFLKLLHAGDAMDEKKFLKCKEVGEIYIRRSDAETYNRFVSARPDSSAAGLGRRCRSQYLALYASYSELVFLLTDQSEHASFGEGKALIEKCKKLCDSLLGTLGEFGDAWDVINNSSIGELGSVERAPTLAAYVALFGLQSGMDGIEETMLAALLAELGLLFLGPSILKKIREDQLNSLTEEESTTYKKYPILSLNIVLERKLALDEKMRSLMLSTQERADGTGFPHGLNAKKIPLGSQLIHYCRTFDRRTMLKLGRPRPDRDKVRRMIQEEDGEIFKEYTAVFWDLMKKTLA